MPKQSPIQKNADTLQEIKLLVKNLKQELNEVKQEVSIIRKVIDKPKQEEVKSSGWFFA
jgi:hypothetical protein